MNWIKFLTAEDLAHEVGVDHEVIVFDGCDYFIDYVETEVEYGSYFMANGSKPEFYCRLSDPVHEYRLVDPNEQSKVERIKAEILSSYGYFVDDGNGAYGVYYSEDCLLEIIDRISNESDIPDNGGD